MWFRFIDGSLMLYGPRESHYDADASSTGVRVDLGEAFLVQKRVECGPNRRLESGSRRLNTRSHMFAV